MSVLYCLLTALGLLLVPWLLVPRRRERPEIHGLLELLWWINAGYCGFWHRLEYARIAPLPDRGPAILIANHTCGVDHMLLQASCRRLLGFMIAQEFYDWTISRPFCRLLGCIPVRRDGHDLAATRSALRALGQGRVLPIFPEGKILPESGRNFQSAKPGVGFLALRAGVPVIPAYIRGTPATNDIVKSLSTPSHARIVYGDPIDLRPEPGDERPSKERIQAVADLLMDAIRSLKDNDAEAPSSHERRHDSGHDPARAERLSPRPATVGAR
jgi:1-acyl-sn-glycerol-3-phosphate acyltransferase